MLINPSSLTFHSLFVCLFFVRLCSHCPFPFTRKLGPRWVTSMSEADCSERQRERGRGVILLVFHLARVQSLVIVSLSSPLCMPGSNAVLSLFLSPFWYLVPSLSDITFHPPSSVLPVTCIFPFSLSLGRFLSLGLSNPDSNLATHGKLLDRMAHPLGERFPSPPVFQVSLPPLFPFSIPSTTCFRSSFLAFPHAFPCSMVGLCPPI